VVDHLPAHRVVNDVDAGGAEHRGGCDAAQLGWIVDDGDRDTLRLSFDECLCEPALAEFVDLDVDAHPSLADQRLEARERGGPAPEQRHLVGSDQRRWSGTEEWSRLPRRHC
jgi:hypothetical protein